jgi:hypothetical protein
MGDCEKARFFFPLAKPGFALVVPGAVHTARNKHIEIKTLFPW